MLSFYAYCKSLVAADWSSDLDTSTVSGAPPTKPDAVLVMNRNATTDQNLVFANSAGQNQTLAVPFRQAAIELKLDIATIRNTTGADIVVVALWGFTARRLNS